MAMIKEGRYKAQILNWALQKTQSDKLGVVIALAVEEGLHTVYWTGYFTEKAIENTLKQLSYCGLKGDDFGKLALGAKGEYLDRNAEIEATVTIETSPDGKNYPKAQWLNLVGGVNFRNTLDEKDAAMLCAGLNLRGEWAAFVSKSGYKPKAAAPAPVAIQKEAEADLDSIPF